VIDFRTVQRLNPRTNADSQIKEFFMKAINKARKLAFLSLLLSLCGPALAGGFIELDGVFGDGSPDLTNPWWPKPENTRFVYLFESEDECVVGVLDVLPDDGMIINGVEVRTLWDREFVVEDECPEDILSVLDDEPVESTYDWYAQDIDGNIWYFGEYSVATDHDECDHETGGPDPVFGIDGCLDGSWQAGFDIWTGMPDPDILEGIIMLANPQKGLFYFQEYWEDEATDMGKVLNFKTIHTYLYDEQEDCVTIKEWVPLSPGNVEHKYYCRDYGLVLVQGNAGGKTEWTDLVAVEDIEP